MRKGSMLYMWSLKYLRNTVRYVQKTAISRRLESRKDKCLGATAYYMVTEIKKLDECP